MRNSWKDEVFTVRPLGESRIWRTESARYPEYARLLLAELLPLVAEIKAQWPPGVGPLCGGDIGHPELWPMTRRRDMLSDSIRIFTAMSVESFLNFYGMVRLGKDPFDSFIERLSLPEKLKALLKICDDVSADRCGKIVTTVAKIAQRRNELVHPKATEIVGEISQAEKDANAIPIPGAAIEAVEDMTTFYHQWIELAPESKFLLPDDEQ